MGIIWIIFNVALFAGVMGITMKENTESIHESATSHHHSDEQSNVKDDPYDSQDPDKFILAVGKEFKNRVKERFEFHEYLINPLEKPWSHTIRVLSIVLNFIRRIIMKKIEKNAMISTKNTLIVRDHGFSSGFIKYS